MKNVLDLSDLNCQNIKVFDNIDWNRFYLGYNKTSFEQRRSLKYEQDRLYKIVRCPHCGSFADLYVTHTRCLMENCGKWFYFKEPQLKNVCRCGICNSPADRYTNFFQCTNTECGALGDLNVGIFTQLNYK